jgi:hypothetical protein
MFKTFLLLVATISKDQFIHKFRMLSLITPFNITYIFNQLFLLYSLLFLM